MELLTVSSSGEGVRGPAGLQRLSSDRRPHALYDPVPKRRQPPGPCARTEAAAAGLPRAPPSTAGIQEGRLPMGMGQRRGGGGGA